MLWLIPAWIVTVVASFMLGYHLRGLKKRIEILEEAIQSKVDKKEPDPEPPSEVIDPLDQIQTAQFEHAQMMKRLNGDNYEE